MFSHVVMQKPNGFNSNRRSQNINKICFSPQVLLPALGWGTCHLLPHFHTRHVPRARLADGARAASFTIFFGHDLPRRSCSSFSDLCFELSQITLIVIEPFAFLAWPEDSISIPKTRMLILPKEQLFRSTYSFPLPSIRT